jgi:DNA-binding NarL/FixJ family response regulator
MHESFQLLLEVLDAGARGYISKSDLGRELISGVESLSKHRPYFSSVSRRRLPKADSVENPPPSSLSPLETEVVRLLAANRNDRQAAALRAAVMQKLRLHSLRDVILYVVPNDLL